MGLEALKAVKTVAEIAQLYQVHPTQVSQWKARIVEVLPRLFEPGVQGDERETEEWVRQLHEKIGQLSMELDWLKKKSKQLEL